MKIQTLCKKRKIGSSFETPLLVPSFSSADRFCLSPVFNAISPTIAKSFLVSAFDIASGVIDKNLLQGVELLFIDSGWYEATELCGGYSKALEQKTWSQTEYSKVRNSLELFTTTVMVSSDFYAPIKKQLSNANDFFSSSNGILTDFLVKPEIPGEYLGNLNQDALKQTETFNILGFTELELGETVDARCKKVIAIRSELNRLGLDVPIHIFGCLDPLMLTALFLCGADIFDGLTWLRYFLHNGVMVHGAGFDISENRTEEKDAEQATVRALKNLNTLEHLNNALTRFTSTYDESELLNWNVALAPALAFVKKLGVEFN